MRKYRFGLIVCASVVIILQLGTTDYSDLSWSNNIGRYGGIFSMLALILAMIIANRDEKKKCK